LPTLVGFEASYVIYVALHVLTYVSILALAAFYQTYGLLLCLLTIPASFNLVRKFNTEEIKMLDQETAQFHTLFGVAMLVGVISGY